MAKVFTTEITSDQILSDNPLHQRLLKPYVVVESQVHGDLLEVGCGEGRGVERVMKKVKTYTAIDKIKSVIHSLQEKYPQGKFICTNIPPFDGIESSAFDVVISFQVIEHIRKEVEFLREIHRVLKPGGKAYLTTPNRLMSLSRNPWHIREYLAEELTLLATGIFRKVEMKGIAGDDNVMLYHERNKKSVDRITRFDILNLQHRMPAPLLKIPYELLNRWNRNKLQSNNDSLVKGITHENYFVTDNAPSALDLFLIVEK